MVNLVVVIPVNRKDAKFVSVNRIQTRDRKKEKSEKEKIACRHVLFKDSKGIKEKEKLVT